MIKVTLAQNPYSGKPDLDIRAQKKAITVTAFSDGESLLCVYGLDFADLTALADAVNGAISQLQAEGEAILRREEAEARAG